MAERVVVLGSNSFSGAQFVDYCLSEGLEVAGISRSPEPHSVFLPYCQNARGEQFRFHQYDLNHDLDAIMMVINAFQPAYVVNFAAQGMVAQSWTHPEQWLETNTVAAVKLHDRLRECRFLEKFVQISTPEVYGHCEGVVAEHMQYAPSTPYAVSKAAADMSLMAFYRAYDFPVVFTRAANVYGPCQQLYRIIPATILNILSGERLQLHGGGVSVRSFIHMRDVSAATLLAARQGVAGEIFHLSTKRTISIRDLVELICQMMDADFDACVEVAPERLGKDSAYLLDSTKALAELGWAPMISLEEGLAQTIAWAREHYDVLKTLPRTYVHKA